MKTLKKQYRIYLFNIILLVLHSAIIHGQEATAFWPLNKNYSTGQLYPVTTTGNITAENIIHSGFTSYGYSESFYGTGLKTTNLNPNFYIQFSLAPVSGYDLHLSSLSFIMLITSNTSALIQVHFSTSVDFSTYTILGSDMAVRDVATDYSFTNLDILVPDGETGYIRVYPYRQSANEAYLRIREVLASGYTILTSPPASISYTKSNWCKDEGTAEVTITGETGGTFSSSPGLVIDAQTGAVNLAESSSATYTVNYTLPETATPPEFTATAEITVNASPACSISGTNTVYPSNSETYSAPAGLASYNWLLEGDGTIIGSSTEQTVTVEAWSEVGRSYMLNLTVGDNNSCTSSCSKEINIVQPVVLPTATLTGTQSVCAGNSAQLVIRLTGEAPWTFTWTDGVQEHTVSETYDTNHTITVFPTKNTTYSLTGQVTDGSGNANAVSGEAKVYFGPVTMVPKITACPNTTIEVPISVKSFSDVRDVSLSLKYNPAVMTYAGFENGEIVFSSDEVDDVPYGGSRLIRISKISGENLPTLEDEAVLLRLKFNFVGGNTSLEWIDSPDNSWCSYSYLSELDETGFETEDFCDVPTEAYYFNGSVTQLNVSGIEVNPIANISTITNTPVIIPLTISYPDLAAQQTGNDVFTDARISCNETGIFPAGTRIFKITYNGISVLASPFIIGGKNNVLLSEILGTSPAQLLNHSSQTVKWEFYIDGITSPANVPVNVEALAYTDLNECAVVLDTESFNATFDDAALSVTESATVCDNESLVFTTEIGYPQISNLHTDIKADTKISAAHALPEGTVIEWDYNNSTNGSYILPATTSEIMLSTMIGTLPTPLQGHSGTDVWTFNISHAGLMAGNEVTIKAVAQLYGEYYIHSEDRIILTVNPIPEITEVSLMTSSDESNWTAVNGTLSAGYEMCADPAEDFLYFDIDELNSSVELSNDFEQNAFYLDINSVPTGFYEYWNNIGVSAAATEDWQIVMWNIITGEAPMFYISYNDANYKIIDGLQYQKDNIAGNLHFSGDYPSGNYIFNGTVTDVNGCVSEVFAVTLNLNSAPVLICPGDITVNNEVGKCGAEVWFAVTATGNPAPEIDYSLPDGTLIAAGYFFPAGTTMVTATAKNDCKTVTCLFNVTVTDNEAPQISCPLTGTMDVLMNDACNYVHHGTDWDASATDNCGVEDFHYTLSGATTGTGTSLNGIALNQGTTTITWNATDAAGHENQYSCSVVVSGINLTGTIRYYNFSGTPMDNTTVTLLEPETGTVMATTLTNYSGEYSFANICPGIYQVNMITNKPAFSINSTDAGQVNAWNVMQSEEVWPSIEKVRFLAGDVNGDSFATAGDAGMIQNYFLTLGTGVTFNKSWVFWKTNHPVATQPQMENEIQLEVPAESSELIQDFYGLVCGDFNRSNLPSSESNLNSLNLKSARAEESLVTLLKGKILMAGANESAELPILAQSSMQIGAISMILNFPVNQLQVMDVFLKGDPEMAAGFNIMDNRLIIGWNSVKPISVEAGEPLLTVRLKMIGDDKGLPVYFEMEANSLNELADEKMGTIYSASLTMDGLKMKDSTTGINLPDPRSSMQMTCYPNPFGARATIRYILPKDGRVNLEVVEMHGDRISILANHQQSAGEYFTDINGKNLIPGVYQLVLRLTDKNGQSIVNTTRIIKQ